MMYMHPYIHTFIHTSIHPSIHTQTIYILLTLFSHQQFSHPRTQNGRKHRILIGLLAKRICFPEGKLSSLLQTCQELLQTDAGRQAMVASDVLGQNASDFLGTQWCSRCVLRFGRALSWLFSEELEDEKAMTHWCWDGSVPGRNQRPWFRDSSDLGPWVELIREDTSLLNLGLASMHVG
jgi:hypothetical protein